MSSVDPNPIQQPLADLHSGSSCWLQWDHMTTTLQWLEQKASQMLPDLGPGKADRIRTTGLA